MLAGGAGACGAPSWTAHVAGPSLHPHRLGLSRWLEPAWLLWSAPFRFRPCTLASRSSVGFSMACFSPIVARVEWGLFNKPILTLSCLAHM